MPIARLSIAVVALLLGGFAPLQGASLPHRPALTLLWPQSEREAQIRSLLLVSGVAERVAQLMSNHWRTPEPVTLMVGGRVAYHAAGGRVGVVPYALYDQLLRQLGADRGDDPRAARVALDAFAFALAHQGAHLVLATSAEEGAWLGEDAATDLGMLLLLEHHPAGGRVVRNALHLYERQGAAVATAGGERPFFAAHAMDRQRYWVGVCQLLGSGRSIGDALPLPPVRENPCDSHYAQLRQSWAALLQGALPARQLSAR